MWIGVHVGEEDGELGGDLHAAAHVASVGLEAHVDDRRDGGDEQPEPELPPVVGEEEEHAARQQELAQQVDALHKPARLGVAAREHVDQPACGRVAKVEAAAHEPRGDGREAGEQRVARSLLARVGS